MKTYTLLLIVLPVFAACASSAPVKSESKATPEMAAKVWRAGIQLAVPEALCGRADYRQCLGITEAECLREAKVASDVCAPELETKYPLIDGKEQFQQARDYFAGCVFRLQTYAVSKEASDCLNESFQK